ncbi:MAG: hypothetical protein WAM97_10330 [Acidimicrobiales bacterium]
MHTLAELNEMAASAGYNPIGLGDGNDLQMAVAAFGAPPAQPIPPPEHLTVLAAAYGVDPDMPAYLKEPTFSTIGELWSNATTECRWVFPQRSFRID